MAAERVYPKSDGDILYGSEANILALPIAPYTGSGFDSYRDTTGTNEVGYELTALTSTQIKGSNYVVVTVMATATWASDTQYCGMKIQAKYTGGAYADDLAYINWTRDSSIAGRQITPVYVTWVHTLTANEKTNGVQFKMFSHSVSTGAATMAFSNIQTTLRLAG